MRERRGRKKGREEDGEPETKKKWLRAREKEPEKES